jgi:membrane protein required for colicin V production
MNIFDIILALPLLWMTYRGFTKGFIIGIVSLIAFILGLYLSIRFSASLATIFIAQFHATSPYIRLISFIAIFLAVIILLFFLGKMLEKAVDLMALGFLNKILGALLGFAKAVVLVSLLLFLVSIIDPRQRIITEKMKQESFLFKPLEKVFPALLALLKEKELKLNSPPPSDTTVMDSTIKKEH